MKSSLINLSLAYALTKLREFPSQPKPSDHEVNTSSMDGFVFVSDPEGEAAQRYRDIVDEILARTWTRKRMVVTSPASGEGKTLTSVNLALALAEKGFTVFLAELTLKRPRYRYVFGAPPTAYGIESVLEGDAAPDDVTFQLGETRVAVASVGVPQATNDLLGEHGGLQRLLNYGESSQNWTILDVPSIEECSAVKGLAAQAGPVVMVARSYKTKLEVFRRAAKSLGSDLDYVILNDIAS